jgi:imidazoleglycerol-phosphate dehydratase
MEREKMKRSAELTRKTNETEISISLIIDGTGKESINTSIPFFNHMLSQVARHGFFDINIEATGDTDIDFHHTVEDTGIVFGKVFDKALGERAGIKRYGHALIPLDEALVEVSVDLSGRPYLAYNADIPKQKVGEFDVELVEEFFRAFCNHSAITLHINVRYGNNLHHIIEASFKAFARALEQAVTLDTRVKGVPSTKGKL